MPASFPTSASTNAHTAAVARSSPSQAFEPVAEELAGDSIEEAVKIRAHGEVPAVVHESFDSPCRRLAIQPPSPGERRGLEQAIEGRAKAGEDQPLQHPVLNRGDVELARVSVAAPQDHVMGPPRLVLAGPQAFGGEPECLGLEVVLGRGADGRGRQAQIEQRPGTLALRGVRPQHFDPIATEAEVQVSSDSRMLPPRSAQPGDLIANRHGDPPKHPERLALIAPAVLQVEPGQAIREQRDRRIIERRVDVLVVAAQADGGDALLRREEDCPACSPAASE